MSTKTLSQFISDMDENFGEWSLKVKQNGALHSVIGRAGNALVVNVCDDAEVLDDLVLATAEDLLLRVDEVEIARENARDALADHLAAEEVPETDVWGVAAVDVEEDGALAEEIARLTAENASLQRSIIAYKATVTRLQNR